MTNDTIAQQQAEIESLNKIVKRLREDIDLPASDIEEFVLHKYEYFAKCKTIASQQAEIEALKLHVQGLQASIELGEKLMTNKKPYDEALKEIGDELRKAEEK